MVRDKPDDQIAVGAKARTLAVRTGAMFAPMERMVAMHRPDVMIAQGDTTTVLVTALTAFYAGVPFAHVEAGLRTGDLQAPFPEEFNRIAADRVARWHFCPRRAVANLRDERVDASGVFLSGNTGIGALRHALEHITPVSPSNRRLTPPLSYERLVEEMARAYLILTDSGGIQEEAPFLKKPVLVLRGVTERPEAVELGVARLVGTETDAIVSAVRELLTNETAYAWMAAGGSPYGDGYAAQRIAAAFGLCRRPASAVG
jgi:UDP-N-acetylglucosamine 2-epimerase (non-hydrolysing)